MSKPAARLGDMHVCPMVTPGVPPIPHVGGPITGPGMPTVLIGNMPAAVLGDMLTCVGPPDTIAMGSAGVMIGGKPAARMGDMTAHGGSIAVGFPTVLIGEVGNAVITPSASSAVAGGDPIFSPSGGGAGAYGGAAAGRPPDSISIAGAGTGAAARQVQPQEKERSWFKAKLALPDGEPADPVYFKLILPDGKERTGYSSADGSIKVGRLPKGPCEISLPGIDQSSWD